MSGVPYTPEEARALEIQNLKRDKEELAKQVRQLQLDNDAKANQIKELSTTLTSVRATRDQSETKLDVYKQILEDLHEKILKNQNNY